MWGDNGCSTVSSVFSTVSKMGSVGSILLLLLVCNSLDGGEMKDGAKLTVAAAAASCSTLLSSGNAGTAFGVGTRLRGMERRADDL